MAIRPQLRGKALALAGALALVFCMALTGCSSTPAKPKPLMDATATTGAVTVTTNLATYATTEPIGVTVTNSSGSTYYAVNGRSACEYVELQQWDAKNGAWVAVDKCSGLQSRQPFAIAPNSAVPFTLAPNSPSDPNSWARGTYRVAVFYTTHVDGVTQTTAAHSAAFTIHL